MSHPPSALYRIFNAWLAAMRKPWKPEGSVHVLFDSPWKEGNELFDWYRHLTTPIIKTMQLRKEREPPFFHEYIAFRLQDNAGCFRIDRRQRPGETHPLAAIHDGGVDAYDTINEIRSLDDRRYGHSDCLIEITFRDDAQVHLVLLLKICRAIAQHQFSRIYTLQRYSCTFHSQTIVLCILQKVIAETAQGHAGSPLNNEIAIDSDAIHPQLEWPMPAVDLPNPPHRNYPAIDFLTREDQCPVCWKLALARRAVGGNNNVVSLENLSGLFWDGVVRVAEHFIQLLDVATGSRNGSWFLCPRFYLVELCQELTNEAIRDTWDTRLRLFERNLTCPGEVPYRCICLRRESEMSSETQRTEVGHSVREAAMVTTNICFPTGVDLDAHYPEIANFFRTNISDVQQEFKEKILQTCQRSKTLHTMLSTYYEAINRRVAIQVNCKHFGRRQLGLLTSRIRNELAHPWLLSESLDQLMKGTQSKSMNLLQESRVDTLHLYMLLLLHAHGVRVEIYKAWLKCDATEVVQDITKSIKDVWKLLNEQQS